MRARADEPRSRKPGSPAISTAIVTGSLSRQAGGLYYSVRVPANTMAARGQSPTVYGVRDADWPQAASEWHVADLKVYDTFGPRRLGLAPRMLRDLKLARHDLIHLRGLWGFPSYATARLRHFGAATLISPEGMLDPWALSQSSVKKRAALFLFESENLRRATAFHALNNAELKHIRDFGLRSPVAIIPNGVDNPTRIVDSERSVKPRIILFMGRIHPKKGLLELIEAWAGALSITPELSHTWQIQIVGWDDGGHESALRNKINRLGLSESIIFRGSLYGDAKERALREASAFILPSHGEGLPISVLEAASYGLPVMITSSCNLPELLDGGAGYQIQADPIALARDLSSILNMDYRRLSKAGIKGREIVGRSFSWSSSVDQYLLLYEWLVYGGAPSARLNLR